MRYSLSTLSQDNQTKSKVKVKFVWLILAETYYCTQVGKIKGVMTLTDDLIMFDPLTCPENEKYLDNGEDYHQY